jgi:cardiolipin synthase
MADRRANGRRWMILLTVLVTVLVVVIALNFVPPERRLERQVQSGHGIADPQFRREMAVMLGPGIVPGNRIVDLQNGEGTFPAMLAAVEAAQRSITFETYIYWSGEVGRKMAEALAGRARAGVEVRVIIDWVGSAKMDAALLDLMETAGVVVHRFRPLRWYNFGRMNNRTHRKLLVVDGHVGFTGGIGIADHWQGHAQDPDHWRDMHFQVEGPVVAQMQAAFNDNWVKATGGVLNGPSYFPPLKPNGTSDAHMFISSADGGSGSMHLMYLMAIASARQSIDLQASYFVPDALISTALLAARQRGVRVRVVVPGPHIDAETVRISSKREWGPLLLGNIEVYEYQPTMLHNKLLVIDRELVSVGSTNFDIRSFRLNDEASLNVYDPAFAARMTEVFEADLKPTIRFTYEMWQQRPVWEKIAERVLLPLKSQL